MVLIGYAVSAPAVVIAGTGVAKARSAATADASASIKQQMAETCTRLHAGEQVGHSSGGAAAAAAAQGTKDGPALAVGSPDTVTALLAAAAASASAQSSGLATPLGADESVATTVSPPASAASTGRRLPSPRPQSPSGSGSGSGSLSCGDSQGAGPFHGSAADLQAVAAQAVADSQQRQRRQQGRGQHSGLASSSTGGSRGSLSSRLVDIPTLVERLKERPLTGQVAAWGWEAAAALSAVRRTMPAQLFSALWPATEACAWFMMPQDILEMLDSWLTLMQQCPRHFRLSRVVLQQLATYAVPAAVKRMGEDQLAQLAVLARDIALHRGEGDIQVSSANQVGSSARDLMQPIFAVAAAETAWRCKNPARYVSAETISAVVTAAPAWSWRVVRHRDSQALAALKWATAAALGELMPHSPRDLPRGAFGKLKMDGGSPRQKSGAVSPRQLPAEASPRQLQQH